MLEAEFLSPTVPLIIPGEITFFMLHEKRGYEQLESGARQTRLAAAFLTGCSLIQYILF